MLSRGQACRSAEAAMVWCAVQIKLHFCFVRRDKQRTNPHAWCVHDARILAISSLSIHTWMLASAVHIANRAKYMFTLRTYRALPCFDGPTAGGSGHAPCCGGSHHTVQLAHMSILAQQCTAKVCSRLYKEGVIGNCKINKTLLRVSIWPEVCAEHRSFRLTVTVKFPPYCGC